MIIFILSVCLAAFDSRSKWIENRSDPLIWLLLSYAWYGTFILFSIFIYSLWTRICCAFVEEWLCLSPSSHQFGSSTDSLAGSQHTKLTKIPSTHNPIKWFMMYQNIITFSINYACPLHECFLFSIYLFSVSLICFFFLVIFSREFESKYAVICVCIWQSNSWIFFFSVVVCSRPVSNRIYWFFFVFVSSMVLQPNLLEISITCLPWAGALLKSVIQHFEVNWMGEIAHLNKKQRTNKQTNETQQYLKLIRKKKDEINSP